MRRIKEIQANLQTYEKSHISMLKNRIYRNDIPAQEMAEQHIKNIKLELYECISQDIPLDRLTEICQAEREGRCVVLTDEIALAMSAGARQIEQHKYSGIYVRDVFGNDNREIPYKVAARVLRETAEKALKERKND